jgi:hypothetical protein
MLKLTALDYTNLDEVCMALKTNTTFPKVDLSGNLIDVDSVPTMARLTVTMYAAFFILIDTFEGTVVKCTEENKCKPR